VYASDPGATWAATSSGTSANLYGISARWVSTPNSGAQLSYEAVGAGGVIDGDGSAQTSGVTSALYWVSCGASTCLAGGASAVALAELDVPAALHVRVLVDQLPQALHEIRATAGDVRSADHIRLERLEVDVNPRHVRQLTTEPFLQRVRHLDGVVETHRAGKL